MTDHPWTRRVSGFAFLAAVLPVVIAFGGMTLARYDIISKLAGFQAFLYVVPVAGVAAVIGLIALIMNWRTGWPAVTKAAIGFLLGAAGFGAASLAMAPAGQHPYIHDITTDLDNPPEFVALTLPEDNMRGVDSVEQWKELHREGYPDIASQLYEGRTAAQVIAQAAELAEERGWTIEANEPAEGRLEAVSYASWIKFEDIVVVKAVDTEEGALVDMRSVSRVGVSDLGVNADRIEEFLGALAAYDVGTDAGSE